VTTQIFIRKEYRDNEFRVPIIPSDIKKLVNEGFTVYVETSKTRCFSDKEYIENGAILVNNSWENYPNALIIGIKELDSFKKLNNHTHIFFSHSYKNQTNSKQILDAFRKSNSKIYDLEYFLDGSNNRLIAFGFHAGIVGGALGIMQYYYKNYGYNLNNLEVQKSFIDYINCINNKYDIPYTIDIGIVGPKGRCGQGVIYLLKNVFKTVKMNLFFFDKNTPKNDLHYCDIIYNCINLQGDNGTWIDLNTEFEKNTVIVDISCDFTNKYNPIKIYDSATTWIKPVLNLKNVSIIAIENLPSLLPYDSSVYFSKRLTQLLIDYKNGDKNKYWENNLNIYNYFSSKSSDEITFV
jgi:saccharopine dehydrogenase (NAD+, L-lysine-forming)